MNDFGQMCLRNGYDVLSVVDLEEMKDDALGKRVYVESYSRSYMGCINHIFSESRRIWLEESYIVENSIPIWGLQTLFYKDILNIAICGVNDAIRKRLMKEFHLGRDMKPRLSKRLAPQALLDQEGPQSLFDFNHDVDDEAWDTQTDSILKSQPLPEPYGGLKRPTTYKIIGEFDESFEESMLEILNEDVTGVIGTGDYLGRSGALHWLAIATSQNVFLIDIGNIGTDVALKAGLKEYFCCDKFTKVCVDAPMLQDFFVHRHGFKLCNAVVPEGYDIHVEKTQKGACPHLFKELKVLLKNYLGLERGHVPHLHEGVDADSWRTRPLPANSCQFLFESVVFLRELHRALQNQILREARRISDFYLEALQEKDSHSAQMFEKTLIPPSILNMHSFNLEDGKRVSLVKANPRRSIA